MIDRLKPEQTETTNGNDQGPHALFFLRPSRSGGLSSGNFHVDFNLSKGEQVASPRDQRADTTGEFNRRNFSITWGMTSSPLSTSTSELKRPKEKRRLFRARSAFPCIARKT